ncbi:tyrosine-type recombinase/integrase [Sphingopyxis yananensis]|uniref:tyrosine-type recombinase/integrase n=1 Tax=Sphingopyxis yananensis TaxID=2886687 RepID=UPI001D10A51E|nr:integrase arm-type DNA-binding domain-containing protein [Sphingopyxis yananensis]MCC2602369.1 integrase arm-type DNA-binding domain-containing protein [Sphingopyxis yananensis]
MALRDLEIRALVGRDRIYKKADERGLYLEVHPNGSKLWRFKYRLAGKDKRIAIGRYPDVGLADARRARDDARRQIQDGLDPVSERKRDKLVAAYRGANSFGDVAREYIDKMVKDGLADVTIVKANWILDQLSPIASLPVSELKPLEVLSALKRIEARGKYETARRSRSFASRVFRYAVATGRAEADPTAVLKGALIVPTVKHRSALLDPSAVGELLRSVEHYSGNQLTRMAMRLLPHLMVRPGELRKATWDEISAETAIWAIPAERMKMRQAHAVPLSRQVLQMLSELHELTGPSGYILPAFHTSRRPLSENTINQAFRRMGYSSEELTAHGLRTTASTMLNESGKWSADAIERSLAHVDRDAIRRIYNRSQYWNERVDMYQWWSDYLDALKLQGKGLPM